MPSMDIVIETDLQEVDNAINQATKEISQRYDFRGSKSKIDWDRDSEITLIGDDEYKLQAVVDVLKSKLVRRSVSTKNLVFGKVEPATEGTVRQKVTLQRGIPQETSKKIVKRVKDLKMKVQSQIQGDQLRISGKKRDDLQTVIRTIKEDDFGFDLDFVNFRD